MSKTISKIIVATYKLDYWLAEICISSIRYWYPDIHISIVYDYSRSASNFKNLRKKEVDVIELPLKKFGWGLSKL